MGRLRWILAIAFAFAPDDGFASEPVVTALRPEVSPQGPEASLSARPAPGPMPTAADCCQLPSGTPVELELAVPITSSQNERGDRFDLRLATPLQVEGVEWVPAGTAAVGEVVHAAAARGGGAPGELILAARTLETACGPIALKGFKLGGAGGDNSGMAIGVSTGIGPFAMFIRGHELEIPASTRATAKLAQPLHVRPDGTCHATPLPTSESPAVEPTKE